VTHTTFQELLLTPFNVHKILGFEILSSEKHLCHQEILFRAEVFRPARCVSHKEKTFVVCHKVTVFFACGFREFFKSLTEMLVGWFGLQLSGGTTQYRPTGRVWLSQHVLARPRPVCQNIWGGFATLHYSRLLLLTTLRTGFFTLSVFSDSGVKTEFIQWWRRGWVVWARGDLNFVGADLRTVHNMNVKMGVVLQQLIAKELTVADALEEVCAQCDGGELTTRETNVLYVI